LNLKDQDVALGFTSPTRTPF